MEKKLLRMKNVTQIKIVQLKKSSCSIPQAEQNITELYYWTQGVQWVLH